MQKNWAGRGKTKIFSRHFSLIPENKIKFSMVELQRVNDELKNLVFFFFFFNVLKGKESCFENNKFNKNKREVKKLEKVGSLKNKIKKKVTAGSLIN